jgi:DNA repair exonuclease SbcCD ATPase subunit
MSFFTVGNLLTLGICALAIILLRYLDRHNRSVDLARNYGKQLKEEIAAFADEKAAAVRDYGVELDVKKSAAKEVLNRLTVTEEDLAEKADAVNRIGERIGAYDKALEELVCMTSRVEENLGRLRDESVFAEQVGKKINEAKAHLGDLEKDIGAIELRFERENSAFLENTAESMVAAVRSTVSDLQAAAETVERQVEDHRAAIDRVEDERKAHLARDVEIINQTLKEALERAGQRANKLEEAALVKLKEDALERVKRFHEAVEEKLRDFKENTRAKAAEIQELLKANKEEQRTFQAEWKRDVEALDALALSQRTQWNAAAEETENRLAKLGDDLARKASEAEQRILREAEEKMAEYRELQARQWERFESMAGEAEKLDRQLRLVIEDSEAKARQDFARFEEEQRQARENQARVFAESADAVRADMAELERELDGLKTKAYENVSEKIQVFEDEFFADLAKRAQDLTRKVDDWQSEFDLRIQGVGERAQAERGDLELSFTAELRAGLERLKAEAGAFEEGIRAGMAGTDRSLAELQEQLKADLEDARLQAENTVQAELGRYSLEMEERVKQNQRDMEDWQNRFSASLRGAENASAAALKEAETAINARLDSHSLETTERIDAARTEFEDRQDQFDDSLRKTEAAISAELERHALEITERLDKTQAEFDDWRNKFGAAFEKTEAVINAELERYALETTERIDKTRTEFDDWQDKFRRNFADTEKAVEDAGNRIKDLAAETSGSVDRLKGEIGEIREGIRDFSSQTRLFEKADELRLDLERRIEDLKGELKGLDQRRTEAAQIEAQCVTARRLGDEVNAKMNRFLSEKHHLDVMESDFNRLISTSQAVEEKLRLVTTSDDILQGMQVQLRKLDEAMKESEERFRRLERKNQVLDEASAGIDRNFSLLEETDTALKRFSEQIDKSSGELDALAPAITELSEASGRAKEAEEKLERLDENLEKIEKRIEDMQVARDWLARAETRFEDINKQVQEHVKLFGALLKDEGKVPRTSVKGAPSIAARDNAIKLARQGWKVDEIATALKMSKGEVELILEMGLKE